MKSLLPLLLLAFTIFSCSKSSVEKTNQPPSVFQATVSNVTINTAQLNWTPSVDPENSPVTYTVTLGNDTLSKKQSGTQIAFANLQLKTFYAGNIIAYDANGNNTQAAFSFTTGDHPSPSDFTISQTNLGITYSTIAWTASTLPDYGAVTYDVYLNNTLVVGNITTTNYRFEPLLEKTTYNVKITAKSAQGKSLDKTFSFTTKENTAPTAPTLSFITSFSAIQFSFTQPTDPKGTTLSYKLFVNNTPYNINTTMYPGYSYAATGLISNTAYSAYILVTNNLGDSTVSNTINFTTSAQPAFSPITLTETSSTFSLSFDKGTNAPMSTLTLFVDNAASGISPISLTTQGTVVTAVYNKSALTADVAYKLKLSVNWGLSQGTSTTPEITYKYSVYTATTTSVTKAYLTTSPYLQFNIIFKDHIISEYDSWEVMDVVFHTFRYSNFMMPGLGAPNKTYITGNYSTGQLDDLRTGSTGYVIIKDASGLHKHNFTYTFE